VKALLKIPGGGDHYASSAVAAGDAEMKDCLVVSEARRQLV
jgi:hypothetical protein